MEDGPRLLVSSLAWFLLELTVQIQENPAQDKERPEGMGEP